MMTRTIWTITEVRRKMLLRVIGVGLGMAGMAMAAELTSGDKASIQEVTGIPSGSLQVSPIAFPGLNACELFDALDQRIKGADAAKVVARISGKWVVASQPDAALQVLDGCASEGDDARGLALLIGTLHQPRLDAVTELKSPLVDTMLRKAGASFQPPESVRQGNQQVVSFLALGPDGQSLLRVTANWQPRVSLTTVIEPVATQN